MPDLTTLHTATHLELRRRGRWEFVHRRNAAQVVALVATTPADEVLFITQHRLPVDAEVVELPAGLVGDEGDADEDPLLAAARELVEETGWEPSRCRVLVRGPSSAGLADEVVTLVRAEGLVRRGPGGGIADENITVHAVPRADCPRWLADATAAGRLIDHKVHAALWWLGQESS